MQTPLSGQFIPSLQRQTEHYLLREAVSDFLTPGDVELVELLFSASRTWLLVCAAVIVLSS